MTKRGIIQLSATYPKFRVSKPDIDVDTAAIDDLLIHEDAIFSQPYYFGFAACPFASFSGNGSRTGSTTKVVPNIGQTPTIMLFPVSNASVITYPAILSEGSGDSQTYYNIIKSWVNAEYLPATSSIRFNFDKATDSQYSPKGCYFMLSRSANA